MLLDEPSVGLSSEARDRLSGLLRSLRQSHGTAMILVEHDAAFVGSAADRVARLAGGELQNVR